MSEPKTEEYEKFRKFMGMSPDDRDEVLWFQDSRFKSLLASEGIVRDIKALNIVMDGHRNAEGEFMPGIISRVDDMEQKVKKLVKSNANLQKALYICTGFWLAVKVYLEFFHKP